MAHLLDNYSRVHEQMLCPKCGRTDWCLVRNDGRACICSRVESGKPMGDAGWMHYLPLGEIKYVKSYSEPKEYLTPADVERYLLALQTERAENMIEIQAGKLGLGAADIKHFQVHYNSDMAAIVFPMFDSTKQPIGCRFRRSDGRKWSLKGGREGIFRPAYLTRLLPLWICEGPTDAAALHRLGFENIIGRPSCRTGGAIIQELLEPNKLQPVLIVADNDPHGAGLDGATKLANQLPNPTIVLLGPTDLRQFIIENRLTSYCRDGILECIGKDDDDPAGEWRVVYVNTPGKFYPFVQHFEVAA